MSNAIKFTPPDGTVTISLRGSNIVNGKSKEDTEELSEEEIILLEKFHSQQDSSCDSPSAKEKESAKAGDSSEMREGADDTGAAADDDKESESDSPGADCIIVDGKEYVKYDIVIVSFVDTGAGISKVIIALA
jgi:signal transduction histidine kinase